MGVKDCDLFPFLVSFLLPGSVLGVPGIILELTVVILEFYRRELGLSRQIKKQKISLGEKGFILIHNSEL